VPRSRHALVRGGTSGDASSVEQAPLNARSADPNKVSLNGALPAVAPLLNDLVVRPVDGGSDPDLASIHRVSSAKDGVPNNLAPALTSFVGREAELDEVGHLLDHARLVTLTGPPGAGKTRLAVEIAERVLGEFEDGVWFVALAALSEPGLMLSTLAEVLGVRQGMDRPLVEAVGAHLKTRHTLVVLDNFEHITAAAPELLALLATAPRLQLLVTSRTRLHLSAEHEYALQPLALAPRNAKPGELVRSDAVELFMQRAEASQSTFRLDATNQSQVDQLCRRLDGLPLAIELAAVRVKLLPIPAILARLDHRLALLSGGAIDLPARHRSLRAAVAWSYELLEPAAQGLFRVLSVFRGGWTVDGAAAVWGVEGSSTEDVLETLASLLDASLVVRETPDSLQPRFTMLETLQAFAAERLEAEGEAQAARARHTPSLPEKVPYRRSSGECSAV